MDRDLTRHDALVALAEKAQTLADENYKRVRAVAEAIEAGLCAYLGAMDGPCVHLVPPAGPFEPRDFGDQAFSLPPLGFRPIAPISFGVAVRVGRAGEWIRFPITCQKSGDEFRVFILDGPTHDFALPVDLSKHEPFFESLSTHVSTWLQSQIDSYERGEYAGEHQVGFDIMASAGRKA